MGWETSQDARFSLFGAAIPPTLLPALRSKTVTRSAAGPVAATCALNEVLFYNFHTSFPALTPMYENMRCTLTYLMSGNLSELIQGRTSVSSVDYNILETTNNVFNVLIQYFFIHSSLQYNVSPRHNFLQVGFKQIRLDEDDDVDLDFYEKKF